jgi:hypothetical protein
MYLTNINRLSLCKRHALIVDNITCAYNALIATNTIPPKQKHVITRDINTLFSLIIANTLEEELCSHLVIFTYAMVVPGTHSVGEKAMRDTCTQFWTKSKSFIRGLRLLYTFSKQQNEIAYYTVY